MSVAFTAEVVIAHKGTSTVAFTREEEKEKEKETEEKKAKEDNFNTFNNEWQAALFPGSPQRTAASGSAALAPGHHIRPFTPPDAG